MEEKQARLRGNSDANLIGEFESTAAFKMLFGQQNLNVTKKLGLIRGWEAAEDRKIAIKDGLPCGWKRSRPQTIAPATF